MISHLKSLRARKEEENQEGFTLIELLIVIVVLGILAAVVVFALGGVTGNAKASACNADAKTIQTAVYAYDASPPSTCTGATCTIGTEVVGTAAGDINPGAVSSTTGPQTFSTGTQAALLLSSGVLKSWPSTTNGYALSLSATSAGDVSVYIPPTSVTPASYSNESASGTTTATAGCNIL